MGAAGESIAAWWLTEHGLSLHSRNVVVDGGEIDLLMTDRGRRVAVEVRTVRGEGDPIDAVDIAKRDRVRRLGSVVGAHRVDFVGVGLKPGRVEIHWVPG